MKTYTSKLRHCPACRMLALFLFVLALFALPAAALPVRARESGTQKLVRIGYYENDNFQAGAADDLVKSGYSYEYMRRLESYTNWKYQYVYGEYGDLYQDLLAGRIDLLTGLAYTAEREDILSYPDLAMGSTPYVFLKRIDDHEITPDPATLAGRKIGTLDGAMKGIVEAYLEDHKIQAKVVIFNDIPERDRALQDGRIDLSIVEGNGTGALEGLEVFAEAGSTDYYVCVNKTRPDILEDLNQAQGQLFQDRPNLKQELNDTWFRTNAVSLTLSESERTWVADHTRIRVGYFDGYLPFSDRDEDGQATGLIKELFPAMMSALQIEGIEIQYQGYASYDEMLYALEEGEVDTAFPVYSNYWASEPRGIILTGPTISTYFNLVYQGQYPDMSQAVIALRDTNHLVQDFARVNYPGCRIELYPSVAECLDAVASKEVDATIIGGLRTDYIIRSKSSYRTLIYSQIAADAPLGFAARAGDQETAAILDHGIGLLDADFALTHSYPYVEKQKLTFLEYLRENIWIVILAISLVALTVIGFIIHELYKNRQHLALTEQQNNDLQRARDEAEEARMQAEIANQAKTTFLFNMSHDIRTPLNAIKGFTELSGEHIHEPEVVEDYRQKILMASNQLTDILNNVLEMARIENNKVVIEENVENVTELVNGTLAVFEGEVKKNDLTMTTSCQVEHSYLYMDKTHIAEVFMNITSNAIKYTPPGGRISVDVRELEGQSDDTCVIETIVADTGIGMTEEFVSRIFEEFSRERNSTRSGIQGTGLGMAIVRNLIDLMHGTIEIQSQVGQGTRITVRIPHRIGQAPEEPADAEEKVNASKLEGKRVLLAEDIDVNAMLVKEILSMQGLKCDRARDGAECIDFLAKAPIDYYDLILMDIQMPVMDGYQATHEIRHMADGRASIPIIALSANAYKEDVERSLGAGMNGHVAKPIDVGQLYGAIASVLER